MASSINWALSGSAGSMLFASSAPRFSGTAGAAAGAPPPAPACTRSCARWPKWAVPVEDGSDERPDPSSDAMACVARRLRLITCLGYDNSSCSQLLRAGLHAQWRLFPFSVRVSSRE